MIKSKHNIDTGKIIAKLVTQFKVSNREIERAIGRPGSSMHKYLQNSSIQTGILVDLCYALKYNIFQDIANQLPPEFGKIDITLEEKVALKNERDNRIATLEEENKILKAQLDIVMKLKG